MVHRSTNRGRMRRRFEALRSGLPFLVQCLTCMVVLGFATPALAQLDTGSISGVVTDPAGKVVPGAVVAARDKATGTTYSTVTNSTGHYTLPSVRPGTYRLNVTAAGFKNAAFTDILIAVGSSSTQDASLAVGSSTEVVSVTGGTATLEKET